MTEATRVEAASPAKTDLIGFLARFAPLIFLIVLMAGFAIAEPRFLTPLNLFNVLRQVSIYGLLAVGMTFVILTAGIDLSIGSLVAFAGLVAAAVAKGGIANRFSVGEGQDALGYGWGLAALAAIARRPRRRLPAGLRHHPAQGAAFRGDARRHVGVPRRGAALRRRRPDQRLRPGLRLVGPGHASFGQVPVPGRSSSSPSRCSPISCCATRATAGRSTPSAAIRRRRGSRA